jgi:hypothetical protein
MTNPSSGIALMQMRLYSTTDGLTRRSSNVCSTNTSTPGAYGSLDLIYAAWPGLGVTETFTIDIQYLTGSGYSAPTVAELKTPSLTYIRLSR